MIFRETWYVYRGANHSTREVYHGVSKDPKPRISGKHCRGSTKAVGHWVCEIHDIEWTLVCWRFSQKAASEYAHALERTAPPRGYRHILTAGI